jgi:hypothetical protein
MNIFKYFLFIVLPTILLLIATTANYAQNKNIIHEIEDHKKSISIYEDILKSFNNKLHEVESGKYYVLRDKKGKYILELKKDFIKKLDELEPWEVINRIDAANITKKILRDKLLKEIKDTSSVIDRYKSQLAKLEKEYNKRFQEGRGYIEVKINKEEFSRPGKNLVRWNWQFRFDEINGVGVTIKQVWIRGYRGREEKINRRLPSKHRIEPYGSKFIDTPYMQYGTKYDKTSSGTMKYVYTGNDDNGNEVKAELEITRYPKK